MNLCRSLCRTLCRIVLVLVLVLVLCGSYLTSILDAESAKSRPVGIGRSMFAFRISAFGLLSGFGLRISDFRLVRAVGFYPIPSPSLGTYNGACSVVALFLDETFFAALC